MSPYIAYMDPMGHGICHRCRDWNTQIVIILPISMQGCFIFRRDIIFGHPIPWFFAQAFQHFPEEVGLHRGTPTGALLLSVEHHVLAPHFALSVDVLPCLDIKILQRLILWMRMAEIWGTCWQKWPSWRLQPSTTVITRFGSGIKCPTQLFKEYSNNQPYH